MVVKGKLKDESVVGDAVRLSGYLSNPNTLRNLDQKPLRDIKFNLEVAVAHVSRYLDIRNEQGRNKGKFKES